MKRKPVISDGVATGCPRPCNHLLTGRITEPKRCVSNYECYRCGYDQWLDALEGPDPGSRMEEAA